jgi:regulator of replication initiation timing
MNIDSRVQFSLLVVALLSLGWTVGYYSRSDRIETLETELNSYSEANKSNFSQTVNELKSVSAVISKNLTDIRSHYNWEAEKKSLKKQVSELTTDINDKKEQLKNSQKENGALRLKSSALQKQLNSYYPVNEEFWMDEKTTRGIAGFEGILGLKDVKPDYVDVTYQNESYSLYAGNYIETQVAGNDCRIILSGILYNDTPEKAQLRTVCKKYNK